MARRKLIWARGPAFTQAFGAPAAAFWFDPLSGFRVQMGVVRGPPGITIMRSRYSFFVANIGAGAYPIWTAARVIGIESLLEAQTDPVHALELSPQTDPHNDWMMYEPLYPNHGADPVTGVPNAATFDIDVKSMRKADELGETLGLVISKPASVAGFSVTWSSSVLVALP